MNWRYWWGAHFDHGKTHCFPEELKDKLLANLEARGLLLLAGDDLPKSALYSHWPLYETVEAGIARGGARMVGDSIMTFELVDVLIKFYAADVEWYIDIIRNAPLRLELGIPYYKIHGDMHCLCLLPEDRDLLLREMDAVLTEANALRDVDFQRYNKAMENLDCPFVAPGPPREHRHIKEV